MTFCTATAKGPDANGSGQALAAEITAGVGSDPALIALYATEGLATKSMFDALRAAFPKTPIFGGTTCRGVITERGVHVDPEGVVAALAVSGSGGDFGTAARPISRDGAAAAADAVEAALEDAGRPYETPAMIWVCAPPGSEEAVLRGIADVVGSACPIVGGSSADETVSGNWRQFGPDGVVENHVAVAVLFPASDFGLSFQSGYAPTGASAQVSTAEGRRILTFDGEPAGPFYVERLAAMPEGDRTGDILAKSTPHPLGRRLGTVGEVEEYLLIHPANVDDKGTLHVFADVSAGEELALMHGDPDSLVGRAQLVAQDAVAYGQLSSTAGGLVIFCGGCMLAVQDRLDEVHRGLVAALPDTPFLSVFTFGEQGATICAGNQHGNLMVAASVFGRVEQ